MTCQAGRGWAAIALPAAAAMLALSLAAPARAADEAAAILKRMSDYVAAQKTLSLSFDSEIEVVTPEIQKIQFTSSGTLDIDRPNRFRAHRVGGYTDIEAIGDGKTLTVFGRNLNAFAEIPLPGAMLADIVAALRERGADLPAADLLSPDAYSALTRDVIDGRHIGRGVIGGVECDHLAFRTLDTDWQIWIEIGDRPIPRKFVITSKAVAAAPQYSLEIRSWSTAPLAADAFAFVPPAGATKIEFGALGDIDEIPPGAPMGMPMGDMR